MSVPIGTRKVQIVFTTTKPDVHFHFISLHTTPKMRLKIKLGLTKLSNISIFIFQPRNDSLQIF